MSVEYVESRIREARLIVASPEVVWTELQRISERGSRISYNEDLEKRLLARGYKLVDLALARYGGEKDVLTAIYKKTFSQPADELDQQYLRGLRLACLSNEWISGSWILFPEEPY